MKHLAVFLVACSPSMPQPEYPRVKCADVTPAALDPEKYATEDLRGGLFTDERATWDSARCDPVRAALPPLGDAHDLEMETLQKECDAASSSVDASIRFACRAGCFADRMHRADVVAWTRALKGIAAFDPKRTDFLKLQASCAAMRAPSKIRDGGTRALWMCAGLPLPPKRFRIELTDRMENVEGRDAYGHATMTVRWTGFDSMSAGLEGPHGPTIVYEECGGAHARWGIFGSGSP